MESWRGTRIGERSVGGHSQNPGKEFGLGWRSDSSAGEEWRGQIYILVIGRLRCDEGGDGWGKGRCLGC